MIEIKLKDRTFMQVLHINQSDIDGGAAIAGYRLHQGLLAQNIDSRLLVGTMQSDSSFVASVQRNYWGEKILGYATRGLGFNYLNHVNSFNIPKHHFYKEADVLNFHNLHSDYFNYLAISKLTEKKPAIFTLHDMWSFTGHCAYSYDCERWKIGCGHCPYPNNYPAIRRDNTRLEWKFKDWVYGQSNMVIVVPSNWLAEQAKQSILNQFSIHYIPYGLDIEAYRPIDAEQCKTLLGIPTKKNVIMFGAASLKDSRKGGDLLLKALKNLPSSLKAETVLLTLGKGGESISNTVGVDNLDLGYVNSDRLKAIAFSAADLFVFPTRADNLPLVLQESMSCGTPMVSFKVGGVPDLVRPGITGYLAAPEDADDFCTGIVQLLEDQTLRKRMSRSCREIAIKEYSLEMQSQRYIELYREVLTN